MWRKPVGLGAMRTRTDIAAYRSARAVRTNPDVARAEPGDARTAAAPPPGERQAPRRHRTRRRDAGAVAAVAVRRPLVAVERVQARVARAGDPARRRREADRDARHAPPDHDARLPHVLVG